MRFAMFAILLAGCGNLLGFEDLHGTVDAVDPDGMTDGMPDADHDGPDPSDGPPTDTPPIDAPIDAPPIDAPPIDAPPIDAPIDARPDAPIDAPPIDAPPIDAAIDAPPIDAPPPQYTVAVTRNGTGTGTVVSAAPAGTINCGADCSHTLVTGTVVTLTATPAANSTFTGWSGPCSGTGNCTFGLTGNTTVTATFALNSYTVTLTKSGTGQGAVTSSPAGISCGTGCTTTSASFTHGASVTLSQSADAASDFTGWSGPSCPGRGSCTFTVTGNVNVSAAFMQPWTVLVDGPYPGGDDRGAGLATDPSGNVFVGGFTSHGPTAGADEDLWVRKLTPSGAALWTDVYNGGADGSETVRGMGATATHVYVSGYSFVSASGRDIFIRRYSTAGGAEAPIFVNGPSNGPDLGTKMTLDAQGNVYVAGHITTAPGNTDGWVAKYNSALVQQWVRTYNGPAGGNDQFYSVAVDATGNVYVSGWHTTTAGHLDVVVRKYNSIGTELWTRTYDRAGLDDWGYGIALDSSGKVYVATTITPAAGNTDAMIATYAPDGTPSWTSLFPGGAVGEARDIAVCPGDTIYAAGHQDVANQGFNIWMRRLNTAGSVVWDRTHSGSANVEDMAHDVACDAAGNVLFTGWVDRTVNGQIWIRKYYQ